MQTIMQTLIQDLPNGARMLLKKPGCSLLAIITRALGIGVNTAIFSVFNSVLLRPLPFAQNVAAAVVVAPLSLGGSRALNVFYRP
jgi:hypothetical protein